MRCLLRAALDLGHADHSARLRERFDRGAENQAFLVEVITGIETVKAMAVEPTMQRCWDDQLAAMRASFRATLLSNTARQIASWLNNRPL